ncbi:hypothetical protein ACFPVS_11645, partial [Neisseria weixii]|uniref:hypothetical protein n=1 Tax=Neisseria weixii TaxID=1853276 RepID=UPI00361062CD
MFTRHDSGLLVEEAAHKKNSSEFFRGNLGEFWVFFAKVSGRLKYFSDGLFFFVQNKTEKS